jgi:hypothetical protein
MQEQASVFIKNLHPPALGSIFYKILAYFFLSGVKPRLTENNEIFCPLNNSRQYLEKKILNVIVF